MENKEENSVGIREKGDSTDRELTIISMQLSRIGMEKTVEMKSPLLSKYCCRENDRQWIAATSLIDSVK